MATRWNAVLFFRLTKRLPHNKMSKSFQKKKRRKQAKQKVINVYRTQDPSAEKSQDAVGNLISHQRLALSFSLKTMVGH